MSEATEIEALWVRLCATRDPALREKMIVQYAPLVKYVVGRMAVSMPGVLSSEDIISYGTIGLIQAVDRYDPSVGVKFETYAIRRIKGAIIDAIRSLQQLSRDATRRARDLEHAYDDLTQELGRLPTNREVANHLGMNAEELGQALLDSSMTVVSLNNPVGAVAGTAIGPRCWSRSRTRTRPAWTRRWSGSISTRRWSRRSRTSQNATGWSSTCTTLKN